MLKLIIKLPKEADANLLMVSALALAHYKTHKTYEFKLELKCRSDYLDYENLDMQCFEPEKFYDRNECNTCYWYEDYKSGMEEYEVDASVLDPFLMETLVDLQKLIPFEMYFEQRGAYDPAKWLYEHPEWTGEIYDSAVHTLFWAGASA